MPRSMIMQPVALVRKSMNFTKFTQVPKRLLVKTTTSVQWSGRRLGPAKLARLIRKIRWFHLPLSFALTLAAFSQFRKFRVNQIRRELADDEDNPFRLYRPTSLELKMYHMLPLRTISRLWGWINSFELPGPIRVPILRSYARMFGCDLDEALMEDLNQYRNLGEFFRRSLKPGLRPIEGDEDAIVSPADGTVLHMGSAKDGLLEQVKGITYAIESFLGPITWKEDAYKDGLDYQQALLHHHDPASGQNATDLYYAVIYLAPGDYHRFHSPVEWTIKYRRHFPGKLYSVRPTFASWFPNLFAVNERVAYVGEWKHGFFSMAPVGAVNVGSMNIYFDEELKTNRRQMRLRYNHEDKLVDDVVMKKGEAFGEFNLGSTIVLIYEAPKQIEFNIRPGMKIKYGQLVSSLSKSKTK